MKHRALHEIINIQQTLSSKTQLIRRQRQRQQTQTDRNINKNLGLIVFMNAHVILGHL